MKRALPSTALVALTLLLVSACESVSLTIADKDAGSASSAGEDGCGDGDCAQTGGAPAAKGGAAGSSVGGTAGAATGGKGFDATGGMRETGGSGGSIDPAGGGGSGNAAGDTGGRGGAAGSGTAGGAGGALPTDPYASRSGPFRVLVYSRTTLFRHDSIAAGINLFQTIATERGIELVASESNEYFTEAGLSSFELVVFLHPTGEVLKSSEQQAFENWMTERHGAWLGVHAASDTGFNWPFYLELIGQGAPNHTNQGIMDAVDFDAGTETHPAVAGLPHPWSRAEEWLIFDQYETWSKEPGFQILGRRRSTGTPVMWTRQYGNFRAFYTALGHAPAAYEEAAFKTHLTGAIFWTVRREHLL
jgi:type 1 glutamine amidotransferase